MGIRARVAVVGILVLATHARADAPPPIGDAIKQASAAHKPLVLEFGAQWCGPCKLFESKVLPDAKVQTALKDVLFVRYDVDDKPGGEAAGKYNVNAYPTFLIVDTKGAEVSRKEGLLSPVQFIELLGKAKQEAFDEPTIRALLREHPEDISAQLMAASWFASHKRRADAIRVFERLSTAKAATANQRGIATTALVRLRRIEQWREQLRAEKLALIRANPDTTTADDLLIATVTDGPATAETRAVVKKVLDAHRDLDQLNHLVYVALAANANQEALDAAKRLGDKEAYYLDTLAETYHASGDHSHALATAQQAVDLAEKRGNTGLATALKANRERFLKNAGDSDEVTQLRLRVADQWQRIDAIDILVERVAMPTQQTAMRDRQRAMMEQMRAEHDLSVAIAKGCVTHAVDNEQAFARVELDENGLIKTSVLMLEPTATPALRDCITKQLTGAKLVADPARPKRTLMIDFHHLR